MNSLEKIQKFPPQCLSLHCNRKNNEKHAKKSSRRQVPILPCSAPRQPYSLIFPPQESIVNAMLKWSLKTKADQRAPVCMKVSFFCSKGYCSGFPYCFMNPYKLALISCLRVGIQTVFYQSSMLTWKNRTEQNRIILLCIMYEFPVQKDSFVYRNVVLYFWLCFFPFFYIYPDINVD